MPEPSRQAFPDQLRGLALLGIVLVNAPFMAISAQGLTQESVTGPVNAAVAFLVIALAQGKFYLIFSFLFGYSATFILRDNAATHRRRYRRRLVALFVIGLIHAIFFFVGDILVSYAILGIGILLVYARSDRAILRIAIVSFVLATVWLVLIAVALFVVPDDGSLTAVTDALSTALADGTFLDAAAARLAALPEVLITLGTLNWGYAFAAFCLGLVAGRHRLLSDLDEHRSLWRRLAIIGLSVGLPVQCAAAWLQVTSLGTGQGATQANIVGTALGFVTAAVLSAGYVGALALLSAHSPNALAWAQPAGRASLSLYIGESVVISLVFSGYGLGWFGQLQAAAVALVAVATWAGLELLGRVWLARLPQGPLEALVTRWTRGGQQATP